MFNYQVNQYQTALFTKLKQLEIYGLAEEIRSDEVLGKIFDIEPRVSPLPPEFPPEVPRISLRSSVGEYVCNIALSRVDLLKKANTSDTSLENIEYKEKLEKIFEILVKKNYVINRIGSIIDLVITSDSGDALKYLKEKAFIGGFFVKEPTELHVIFNEKDAVSAINYNNVIKLVSKDPTNIEVQFDINTDLKNNKPNFNKDDFTKITSYAGDRNNKLLERLFDLKEVEDEQKAKKSK